MKINFRVVDRKIVPNKNSLALFEKLVSSYNNTGKELVMEVLEYSRPITEKQISLYKALILHTVEASGHTYTEIEEIFLNNFSVPVYYKDIFGNDVSSQKKVEDMDNKEFDSFIKNAILFTNTFFNTDFKTE